MNVMTCLANLRTLSKWWNTFYRELHVHLCWTEAIFAHMRRVDFRGGSGPSFFCVVQWCKIFNAKFPKILRGRSGGQNCFLFLFMYMYVRASQRCRSKVKDCTQRAFICHYKETKNWQYQKPVKTIFGNSMQKRKDFGTTQLKMQIGWCSKFEY